MFKIFTGKEIYNKYDSGWNGFFSKGWGEAFLFFGYLFLSIFLILALSVGLAKKNNVKAKDISSGTELLVNKWKNFNHGEIPIYQFRVSVDEFRDKDDPKKLDTIFHYKTTVKIDSTFRGKRIGKAKSNIIKDNHEWYIEFKKDKSIKIGKPHEEDFTFSKLLYENSLSKSRFLRIDDIMLDSTIRPEGRWFSHFIAISLGSYFFYVFLGSLTKLFKKSIPRYGSTFISKSDRRFKTGKKSVAFGVKVSEYVPLNKEELRLHRKQQMIKCVLSLISFLLLFMYLKYLWES